MKKKILKINFTAMILIFLILFLSFWFLQEFLQNQAYTSQAYISTTTTVTTLSTTTPTASTTTTLNKSLTREVFIDIKSGEGLLWFSNDTIDDVKSAMRIWEEKTNHIINFEEVRSESVADIVIKFSESFNKSSLGKKTIGEAYAYLGQVRGIIYIQPSSMSCRNQVRTMHEIGHIIGLNHSTIYNSVMYPIESCVQNITDEDAATAINLISQFI